MKSNRGRKIKIKKLQNSPYAISEDQVLGKGSFATIKRAYNLQNLSQSLAVKIISVKDEDTAVTIKSQLQMLKALSHHPNLVNFVKLQISTEKNLYVIMEYCNQGNLQKYIHVNKNKLPQEKIWFFLKQFCQGYKAIYDKNIVHRDIKPENVLIHNGNFKLADFGLAKFIQNVQVIENMSSKGTPLYMAPQLHLQKSGNSKVDIFSLGVILYRLAFKGKYPFFDQDRTYHTVSQYFKQLMLRKLIIPENHGRSNELIQLIKGMLQKKPEQRLSWKDLFQNKTIKFAVRNERRKQMVSVQQFNFSLISVGNNSIAKVQQISDSQQNSQKNTTERSSKKDENNSQKNQGYLTIQQAFQKKLNTKLQKKLCQSKIIYTLIDIANRRISKTVQKQSGNIHTYITNQLQSILYSGMQYSLSVISKLQNVSGEWDKLQMGQLLNFQDIFENDREIIIEKIKQKNPNFQISDDTLTNFYKNGTYQNVIYNYLTEFHEYPKTTRQALLVITGFLLQIYDMVLKLHQLTQDLDTEDYTSFDERKEIGIVSQFQQYLNNIQKIKQSNIVEKMKKMGLYII